MGPVPVLLEPADRELLARARRAVLGTIGPTGRPRLVPVCYWLAEEPDKAGRPLVYTPLDEKPKASLDPSTLARVRDIQVRPAVSLLLDRWDEDWSRLAWLRLDGEAALVESRAGEAAAARAGLRDRYRQCREQALEDRPLIRIAVERITRWSASG